MTGPDTERLAEEYRRRVANGEDPDAIARDLDAEALTWDEWWEAHGKHGDDGSWWYE